VCSLDAAANLIIRETLVAPGSEFIAATDARRKEYYWARFDSRGNRLSGPRVESIQTVTSLAADLSIPLISGVLPHAIDIAARAERGDRHELSPMYLREADAQPSAPVSL
jgi:tRNA A37 threonylcarbamoyladenosine modification protein TsaB